MDIGLRIMIDMDSTTVLSSSPSISSSDFPSTTEKPQGFNLPDYLSKNYIIIVIPSVFLFVFILIIVIVLLKRYLAKRRLLNQLETYSSIKYDDEDLDEELGIPDDIMYTSCRLLVGEGFEDEHSELANSEPEYDCMSVDVSVNANASSIVDWGNRAKSLESSQELGQSLKTLPHSFWKR